MEKSKTSVNLVSLEKDKGSKRRGLSLLHTNQEVCKVIQTTRIGAQKSSDTLACCKDISQNSYVQMTSIVVRSGGGGGPIRH